MYLNNDKNLFHAPKKMIGGTKWGYINDKGKYIIKPIFEYAEQFQKNGRAIVHIDSKSAVIDINGKYIIKPSDLIISEYVEGRASGWKGEKSIMFDEDGNVLFETRGFIGNMHDNRAYYSTKVLEDQYFSLYGYIDRTGLKVIPPKYLYASQFKDGKAIVKAEEDLYALIDKDGYVLHTYNYDFLGDLGDGLITYSPASGEKFGFINENGEPIIPPAYDGIEAFTDNRAIVNVFGKDRILYYAMIDLRGNYIYKPEYSNIYRIGENKIALGVFIDKKRPFAGEKYAIADLDGNLLSDFVYQDITKYENGYLSVNDEKNTYFLDRSASPANLPIFTGVGKLYITDGLIYSVMDNRRKYTDSNDRKVWSENGDIYLNDKFLIEEKKYSLNKYYIVYYPSIKGMRNQRIQRQVNLKLKHLSIIEEPKKQPPEYSYEGDYDVTYYKKNLLQIVMRGYKYYFGAAHGMPRQDYFHIDLMSGKFYELDDLFKKNTDYVGIISTLIKMQIEEQGEASVVFPGSFIEIDPDQSFYIEEDTLIIYFSPYEIAPYAAGFPTFEITFKEIDSIINKQGDFWKSFK